jgi:hypothetical protein
MASHDNHGPDRDGGSSRGPGLDSNPELVLAMGEELLSRTREVARGIDDRVRRTLGTADVPEPART